MATSQVPVGLATAYKQAQDALSRADSKANCLLSLFGAALAGVIALASSPLATLTLVALWVSGALIAASVLVLLAAVRPRMDRDPAPTSWLYAAQVGPQTLLDTYLRADSALATAHDVCVLARFARAKYRRIQLAVLLLAAGLGVAGVALVLSVVA